MSAQDWNPELYLKFGKERIQPSIDLVSRIEFEKPLHIVDIGCGPGNSTQILRHRWPDSTITGIDNSPSMIEKARQDYPDMNWQLADAGRDSIQGQYDIVFSNATLQWIPDHAGFFARMKSIMTAEGLLAVQIPLFFEMPLGKAIERISKEPRWAALTESATDLFTIHDAGEYYDMLSAIFSSCEIWQTDYFHVMKSHQAILEMISSTGLKPYIDRLESDTDVHDFQKMVLESLGEDYRQQSDGRVLFPFKRLFMIAKQ